MYHSATICWPSGLIVGHSIRTTLSRIALISGSFGAADEVVEQLRRVLRAGDFGRVQAAVDVDERLALAREPARLGVGQSLRMRQPPRDLPVVIDLREILRRRHQREVHRAGPASSCRPRRASRVCSRRRASGSSRATARRWRACSRRRDEIRRPIRGSAGRWRRARPDRRGASNKKRDVARYARREYRPATRQDRARAISRSRSAGCGNILPCRRRSTARPVRAWRRA